MPVIFTPYPSLQYELQAPTGMVGKYIYKRAQAIAIAAKRQVGVSTGLLKASIHVRHERGATGQYVKVGSSVRQALLHHEGSKPHVIVANRAQTLRFTAGGRVVYTRQVSHPGTRANRYLTDNLYLAIL
jgi:hypothetical protein